MIDISLNSVDCDWLTITSYNKTLIDDACRIADGFRPSFVRSRKLSVGNYKGVLDNYQMGTLFIGDGIQQGRTHCMLQISSRLASLALPYIMGMCERYARCTRFDIQSTVRQPVWWCQWEFLHWARSQGIGVGFYTSSDGEKNLETVYLGSRKSDKFSRVYQKRLGSGLALRFETQYSKDRANMLMSKVNERGSDVLWDVLSTEHKKHSHRKLGMVMPHLRSAEQKLEKVVVSVKGTSSDKTDDWLISRVLPTLLKRVSTGDEGSKELFRHYWDGLKIARMEGIQNE